MNIEPLELRIAPAVIVVNATTATWLDVDGDFVTMKISKPVMASIAFTSTDVGFVSTQVTLIDLTNPACEGISVTITAKPSAPGGTGPKFGDGFVNIGGIEGTGRHLGSISLRGDLGKIDVGDGTGTALKSLSVQSIFALGTSTGATSFISNFSGDLGSLKVARDIVGGYVRVGIGGDLGSAFIGGSLRGGFDNSGQIYAEGTLGPVTVKGHVVGHVGAYSGAIGAGGDVKGVTIGGSLLGGGGDNSGSIYSGFLGAGDMGPIKVGGDVRGGLFNSAVNGVGSGVIRSTGDLASVSIGGSLLQHRGQESGRILVSGDAGAISIRGSIMGGAGGSFFGGDIHVIGDIKSVTVGGSVVGGVAAQSGAISGAHIGKVSIGGDLLGGIGSGSGTLLAGAGFDAIVIRNSIVGGNDPDPFDATPRALGSGQIRAGSVGIGKLSVGGSILGGNVFESGSVVVTGKIGSMTVGGDVAGASGTFSGFIRATTTIDAVSIRGSLLGGSANADNSGEIVTGEGIGKAFIGGDVAGGLRADFSGTIFSNGPIGSVVIGGDLRGGQGPNIAGTPPTDTGSIQGQRIGSVVIGGSIIATGDFGPAPVRAGSIHAVQDIGSIVVKGDLIGTNAVPVLITASGQANPTATVDVAIKSLTVGGSVSFARILAGYDRNLQGANGDAQIGTIKVGGDWTAGFVVAGVNPVDSIVGNGNDITLDPGATGPTAKIASIVIGGQVRGQPGTNNTFGFGAEHVGAMKVGGVTVPLLAGARNDTFSAVFANNKARPLGSSLSPATVDGLAMHVFEV